VRSNFFALGQLDVALSRARKEKYILLIHKEENPPKTSPIIHNMPVAVANPTGFRLCRRGFGTIEERKDRTNIGIHSQLLLLLFVLESK